MVTEAKSRILAAAVAAFLDSGFEVPLSRIWTKAGLSNGSFFHVFKTRRALIEAVVSMILAERQAARMAVFMVPGTMGEATVTCAVTACLRWCETEAAHARVLLILPTAVPGPGHGTVDGPASPRGEIDILEAWAGPLIGRREIRPLSGARLHALIFGPAELAVRQWLQGASAENPLSLAQDLGEAAWAAIKARPVPPSVRSRRPTRPEPADQPQNMLPF